MHILGDLEQEGKGKVGNRKRILGSMSTYGFLCRYRVECMFSSLVLECMDMHVDFPNLSIS